MNTSAIQQLESRLLRIALIGSSLLSVVVAILMIASLWRADEVTLYFGSEYSVYSAGGGIELYWARRYELRDYNATHTGKFQDDSTGRLLRPNWGLEHWCDQGWYGLDGIMRFETDTYDAINGGFGGPTDWTVSHDVVFPHWSALVLVLMPSVAIGIARWIRYVRSVDLGRTNG